MLTGSIMLPQLFFHSLAPSIPARIAPRSLPKSFASPVSLSLFGGFRSLAASFRPFLWPGPCHG